MKRWQSRETPQMYQCGEWLATARSSIKSILMRNLENGAMSWTYPWSALTGPWRTQKGQKVVETTAIDMWKQAGWACLYLYLATSTEQGCIRAVSMLGADITVYLKNNRKWRLNMIMMNITSTSVRGLGDMETRTRFVLMIWVRDDEIMEEDVMDWKVLKCTWGHFLGYKRLPEI